MFSLIGIVFGPHGNIMALEDEISDLGKVSQSHHYGRHFKMSWFTVNKGWFP